MKILIDEKHVNARAGSNDSTLWFAIEKKNLFIYSFCGEKRRIYSLQLALN